MVCLLLNLLAKENVKKSKNLKKLLTNKKHRNIIYENIKSYDEVGQEINYCRELMFGVNQYNCF